MSERDDRELDDYLRGGSRLSAAYRGVRGEEPSADLDEVLLERSRRELRLGPKVAWSPFTRSWSLPLALAAMLVVMGYSVAYFGVLAPDRVVKYRLIRFLFRGMRSEGAGPAGRCG